MVRKQGGCQFNWRSEIIWHQSESLASPRPLGRSDVRRVIEAELKSKGVRFAEPDEAPEYSIVAAILMGDSAPASELQSIVQLYPALRSVSQTLERGTLLVAISYPGSEQLLWRGAVQVFLLEGFSRDEGKSRLEAAVRSLFARVPLH